MTTYKYYYASGWNENLRCTRDGRHYYYVPGPRLWHSTQLSPLMYPNDYLRVPSLLLTLRGHCEKV